MSLAQDLGPKFKKVKDGIYVYDGKNLNESNCTIILTQEGVVLIDSGQSPKDSAGVAAAIKKLTASARAFHHTYGAPYGSRLGRFSVFTPGLDHAHAGATDSMKAALNPKRSEKLIAESAELRRLRGIPYCRRRISSTGEKMTLNVGKRAFELYYRKNVHSEADSAIGCPRSAVLFSASGIVVDQINIFRPFVTIPDILAAAKMMKAL